MSSQRLELLNIFADGSTVVVGRFKSAENSGATLGAIITGVGTVSVVASITAMGALSWVLAPIVAAGAIIIPRLTLGRLVARETRRMSQLASQLTTLLAARQPQEYGERDV